ncbi:hypothetical protein WJX77_005423 [Trebouxia sp. C0004]
MSNLDVDLLLSVVKGLGSQVADAKGNRVYCKDDDCLPCLKDLQRLLRQDESETKEAFQILGVYNIAASDLIPIIVTYPKETDIVYNALKVLTYLTMPIDPASENKMMQAEYMQLVKEAFMEKDAMAVIVGLVAEPLSRHPRMTEADGLIVQLIITFIRNLLTIPDRAATAGSGGDHRTRLCQALLIRMFDDNVMELLLVIAQHAHAKPFRTEAPLLMEIFQQVFKGATAAELAQATAPVVAHRQPGQARRANIVRPKGPGMANERAAMERQQQKLRQGSSGPPARHARFGGLFVRRYNAEDRGSVVRSNPLASHLPALPELKKTSKTVNEHKPAAQLQSQLVWRLRQYLEQLLEAGSFGVVMAAVLQDLKPGLHISRLSRDAFVCFFRFAKLATAFVRIQQDKAMKQKQEAKKQQQPPVNNGDTATSSAAAGDAVPPAVQCGPNGAASGSPAGAGPEAGSRSDADPEGSRKGEGQEGGSESPFACVSAIMGWETFQMVHVLWIGLVDMPGKAPEKDWDMQHESLALLKELLFALDLALYMGTPADNRAADRLQRRLLHDDMKESGLLPVVGRLLKNFNFGYQPRSHAVDLVQALHIILHMLDRLNASEAGGFLVKQKARGGGGRGRKKKPLPSTEGTPTPSEGSPKEGTPGAEDTQASPSPDSSPAVAGGRTGDPFEEAEREEEEETRRRLVREVAYDLQRRVKQELAFPAVIHFYSWLLQGFASNGVFVNHCLAAFLRRIADPAGLDLEAMLYQLSVLRVFQSILSDKVFRKQEGSGEVVHLATHVTRNLCARLVPDTPYPEDDGMMCEESDEDVEGEDEEAASRREARRRLKKETEVRQKSSAMMFIELMFWKNASVAEAIRDEYNWRDMYDKQRGKKRGLGSDGDSDGGQIGFGSSRPAKMQLMSDKQACELREVFEEVNGKKDCLQRCVTAMPGAFKKSQISRQLKAMGLKRNRLTEPQEKRLRSLFAKHHEDKGYLAILAEEMSGGFSRGQVSSQLRKLGLKQAAGSKHKGKKRKKEGGEDTSSSSSGSGSDSASLHSDSSGESEADDAEAQAQQAGDNAEGRDAGGMSADQSQHDSKGRKGSSSKKGKKQKRQDEKGTRTNINDWSSDDSDEAEPAPMPDQLDSMSDSDDDNQAAAAAAAKASNARAESAKSKKDGKLQKAGDRKRKGGSNKGKERDRTGKERAAPAQVTDWTSDDSDAEPAPLPDQLDSVSDSDQDTQAAGRRPHAVVGPNAATARQAGKQHGSSHRSRSPDDLSVALGQGSDGIDASLAGDVSDSDHQQRAKRKGRLRKARASPVQGQQAEVATSEGDDIMVELEDDVPGLDAAPEAGSNYVEQQAATAGTNSRPEQAEHMGHKRKSKGGESSTNRVNGDDAENEAPEAPKPMKRLTKQVDIPNAARSALDTLKQQRLQRQALASTAAAPKPSTLSMLPPVEDTLPPSWAPADSDRNPAPLESTMLTFADQVDGNSVRGRAMGSPPVTVAVLMSSDDDQNQTKTCRDAGRSHVTAETTVPMPMDQPQGSSKDASVTDTLINSRDEDEDATLIRQAVESQEHGDVASSPALDQEDDDALLQGLLAEEEQQSA